MTIFEEDIDAKITELYENKLTQVPTVVKKATDDYVPIAAKAWMDSHLPDAVKAEVDSYLATQIQTEVENYLKESPMTTTVELSLASANWIGSIAPYTLNLTNAAFAKASDGIASLSSSCTEEQYKAAAKAGMRITSQNGSTITITASGVKPAVNIPISIILINKRS